MPLWMSRIQLENLGCCSSRIILPPPPLAPIMSNAADLHNELSRVAPSYQHNDNRQAVAVVTIISCGCCSLNVLLWFEQRHT